MLFSIMSNLQTQSHFKLYFQIVDKHTGVLYPRQQTSQEQKAEKHNLNMD